MQALPANIIELELALNEVTPEGAQALAAALQRLPHLQRLNLRENELENKGAIAIAKGLAKLKNLRELDLTQNQVLLRCAHDLSQPHFSTTLCRRQYRKQVHASYRQKLSIIWGLCTSHMQSCQLDASSLACHCALTL